MKTQIDVGDYPAVISFAKAEADHFVCPSSKFAGGRFQTQHPCIFIHVKGDGVLGKIEICKPGGSKFYLNP